MMKIFFISMMLIAAACVSQQELPSDIANGGTGAMGGGNANGGTGTPNGGSSGVTVDAGTEGGAGGNSSPDANNTSTAGGTGGMAKLDAMKPPEGNAKVIKIQPDNNATGVSETTPVVVTFDSPMDRESVAAAFSVATRKAVDFTFTWNADSTILTAMAKTPLEYARAPLGSTTIARSFNIKLQDSAKDQTGRPLLSFESTFKTNRIFDVVGQFFDASVTAQWSCSFKCTDASPTYRVALESFRDELCVGPFYVPPPGAYFWDEAFLFFGISGLPDTFKVRSASLTLVQTALSDTPLMGRAIAVDVAAYVNIPKSTIPIPPSAQGALSTGLVVHGSANLLPAPATVGEKSADIREGVAASLVGDRNWLMLRVRLDPEKPWVPAETFTSQAVCYAMAPGPTLKVSIEVP